MATKIPQTKNEAFTQLDAIKMRDWQYLFRTDL